MRFKYWSPRSVWDANSIFQSTLSSVSIPDKTSYGKISQNHESARSDVTIFVSFWNLTGTLAAVPPMYLSHFRAIRWFDIQISWLRDVARSYNITFNQILKQGPVTSDACPSWATVLAEIISMFFCNTQMVGGEISRHSYIVNMLTIIRRETGNQKPQSRVFGEWQLREWTQS